MPVIHIIVAMTKNLVIGYNGQIPWNLPEELDLFRQLTINQTVLMGRTTYTGIGRPLAQRHNIVISQTLQKTEGITICNTFAEGVTLGKSIGKDVFCIGGVEIYRKALPIADSLHISWIEEKISGDRFFPVFDLSEWHETTRQPYPGFVYCSYTRKKSSVITSQSVKSD